MTHIKRGHQAHFAIWIATAHKNWVGLLNRKPSFLVREDCVDKNNKIGFINSHAKTGIFLPTMDIYLLKKKGIVNK